LKENQWNSVAQPRMMAHELEPQVDELMPARRGNLENEMAPTGADDFLPDLNRRGPPLIKEHLQPHDRSMRSALRMPTAKAAILHEQPARVRLPWANLLRQFTPNHPGAKPTVADCFSLSHRRRNEAVMHLLRHLTVQIDERPGNVDSTWTGA